MANNREIQVAFERFFEHNSKRDLESASGIGSSMFETRAIRAQMPDLFRKYALRTMIDAPCGDLNWVRDIVPSLQSYVGVDIVDSLIKQCQARYGDLPNVSFRVGDITTEVFEPVDVIMSRDCLVHFSTQMILDALENFRKSGSRYLLTTHYLDPKDEDVSPILNREIKVGQWRPVCLTEAPFNLAPPVEMIDEESRQRFGAGKTLALFAL